MLRYIINFYYINIDVMITNNYKLFKKINEYIQYDAGY